MKLLIPFLLYFATSDLVSAQDLEPSEPQQPQNGGQDYLVQILLNISEARIPNYLTEVIYNRPVEKGISTQAVLNLFQIHNISLATTRNILQTLNISQDQVLSINSLNHTLESFNWTFTNFYNTLTSRLNLAGVPLRNALIALKINVNEFSAGITWGDPDPWQEFIRGNFTQENLQLACDQANITLEQLWSGVRDIFVTDLVSVNIQDFLRLLLHHNISQQQALIVWDTIPVTLQHLYSQPLYSNIIGNFSSIIRNQTTLGVIIGAQEIAIPGSLHEVFREERDLLDIQALTLETRNLLNVTKINDTIYRNLVVLSHSGLATLDNLTVVNVAHQNHDLTNCSYVTWQNNGILIVNVPSAIFIDETYEIPRLSIQNIIPGSALICNGTVYGLAKEAVGDIIIVDAFSKDIAQPSHSCAEKFILKSGLSLVTLLAIKIINF